MSAAQRTSLAVLAALCAVLFVVCGGLLRRDPGVRGYELMPDMVESKAAESLGTSGVFADGQVLQAPVPGSIARGYPALRFDRSAEGARLAGAALTSPIPEEATPRALERGQQVYQAFCTPCHGLQGAGDGRVTARGVPPPPPLGSERVRAMPEGELFHIVTFGQGNMAAHGPQIERLDRWRLVRYVQRLAAEEEP